MEIQRFDALTRGMGARANRRDAIRWLGLAALSAIGWSGTVSTAAAQSAQVGYGDPCEMIDGSCQSPYTCFEAVCDLPRGCVAEGQLCVDAFPCCADDGLTCVEGICSTATQASLPATGVGVPHDTERVAGLTLAGAAVLVAGKLIRDKERDPEL